MKGLVRTEMCGHWGNQSNITWNKQGDEYMCIQINGKQIKKNYKQILQN